MAAYDSFSVRASETLRVSMKDSLFSRIAKVYLGLAGSGYILAGLVLCQNDGSIFWLLILVPSFVFTSFPFGVWNGCNNGAVEVIPSLWSNSSLAIMVGIGIVVFLGLNGMKSSRNWVYVLYAVSGVSFLTVMHNLLSGARFGQTMLSLANASLFLIATLVLDREATRAVTHP